MFIFSFIDASSIEETLETVSFNLTTIIFCFSFCLDFSPHSLNFRLGFGGKL